MSTLHEQGTDDSFLRLLGQLMVRAEHIRDETLYKPAAYVLPHGVLPFVTKVGGTPVIRGDKAGLLYTLEDF